MAQRLYFGHPKGIYGTDLEHMLKHLILSHANFLQFEMVNPSDPEHERNVRALLARVDGSPMPYFLDLVSSCNEGIFLPFPDGMWGCGIFDEAAVLLAQKKRVWTISTGGTVSPVTTLDPLHRLDRLETRGRNLRGVSAFTTNAT